MVPMKKTPLKDIFKFLPKSKLKAGDGLLKGVYPFYTSSPRQKLFYNEKTYSGESVIFGTGGSPSIHYNGSAFATSTDCLVAQAKSEYPIKLAFYYLASHLHLIEKGFKGAGLKHLSEKYLEKIEIPILPLEQQSRAIAILDKVQGLIEKRKGTIELCDSIIRATFLEMFGDPVSINKKIPKALLSKIGEWQSGGTPPRSKKQYFEGDIPWFSSGELNDVFISESKERITEDALTHTSAKPVKKNSLLIGMYDTAALKSSITTIDCSCNQAIAFAEIDETICNNLFAYFAIQLSKDYYLNKRRGARQKNLNLTIVKNIKIPLPEISLQKDFEKKASFQLKIKEKLLISQAKMEYLFQSIIQEAFSGIELVKEEQIFEDLLEVFELKDFIEKKERLRYLISLVNQQKITKSENYTKAKELIFKILATSETGVKQHYNKRKAKIELILG